MPDNEKSLNEMTASELAAGISAYHRSLQPPAQSPPLPPGIAATDSPKAIETSTNLYLQSLLDKPGMLTPAEQAFVQAHLVHGLRALGI
jgi:hypothetical protein